MRFLEPVGHAGTVGGLLRAAAERRLAHALLFTGPDGIGKFLAAEWLAFGLLCARGPALPCGRCGPCKRNRVGTHADVFVLDPEAEGEEEIKISWITPREKDPHANVWEFLALRPMEGGWRVVLLRDADRMNEAAQNAFLKTLEEPGSSTLFVLVTARPETLLPTTRSRCASVRLRAPGADATAGILLAQDVPAEEAARLARWSGGAPGAALALRRSGAVPMRRVIAGVIAGTADPIAGAAAVSALGAEFPGRTPSAKARARARACLDLLIDVLADRLRAGAGVDRESLAHGDLVVATGGDRGDEESDPGEAGLGRRLELVLQARQDVDANLAPDAILERAFLAIEPLPAGGSPSGMTRAPARTPPAGQADFS